MYAYIYIYMYTYGDRCVYTYTYIYIHIYTHGGIRGYVEMLKVSGLGMFRAHLAS